MTVNANVDEYKSVIGLDDFYVALITADTVAAYTTGTPETLAPAVEVSLKPVSSQETQYADNQPYDVFASEAETDMELTMTGLPNEMKALILGKVFDAATGRIFDNGGTPPYMALGFRAMKSNGSYQYVWFLKVQFSAPEEGAATKADKASPKTIKMSCKAIKTVHQWTVGSVTDSFKSSAGDEDTDNFSSTSWFSLVQEPGTSAPAALSLSSSDPADGASNVAVNKTITLTFNNALLAGEINHVVVSKADGTIKACTNSLDTTKKIMTVNPDTDLDASTTTYIVAIGVTDIYGQSLKSVVNFATVA